MADTTRLVALARTFHSLEEAPLVPWNAGLFDLWAAGHGSSGCSHAAAFVLSILNSNTQRPAEGVRRYLCEWYTRCADSVARRLGELEDDAPAALRKRLHTLDDQVNAIGSLFRVGDQKGAYASYMKLSALALETVPDRLLGERIEVLGAAIGEPPASVLMDNRPSIPIVAVLKRLHEGCPWRVGSFNVGSAFATWDDRHRAAWIAWARAPWWM